MLYNGVTPVELLRIITSRVASRVMVRQCHNTFAFLPSNEIKYHWTTMLVSSNAMLLHPSNYLYCNAIVLFGSNRNRKADSTLPCRITYYQRHVCLIRAKIHHSTCLRDARSRYDFWAIATIYVVRLLKGKGDDLLLLRTMATGNEFVHLSLL